MSPLLIAMILAVPGGMLAILALTSYLEGWVEHTGDRDALQGPGQRSDEGEPGRGK